MNRIHLIAIALGSMAAGTAQASIFGTSHEDYLGLSGYLFMPDSEREASNGLGGSVHYGFGLNPTFGVELRGFGAAFEADDDAVGSMAQIGGGLNLMVTPGGSQWFLTAGAGLSETGEDDHKNPSSYIDAGLGWRTEKRPSSQLRWRFDARGVDHVGHDGQIDLWLGAGLEYMFLQPQPIAAASAATALQAGALDADEDGVADSVDRCAGTKGGQVDADGCSWEARLITISDLRFASESSTLSADLRSRLDEVAQSLASQPYAKVEIQGHADATDSEARNLALSKRRAEAVRDYLVGKGIDASRLTAEGYGEMRPIASNETEPGKASNRRVELHIHARQPT